MTITALAAVTALTVAACGGGSSSSTTTSAATSGGGGAASGSSAAGGGGGASGDSGTITYAQEQEWYDYNSGSSSGNATANQVVLNQVLRGFSYVDNKGNIQMDTEYGTLEKTSDNAMAATVVLKIGPIKATFTGAVTLENLKPPHGYTIAGEGKGGIAGFAKGGADVTLAEDGPNATVLIYAAKADVGGKIAQLGSRLITSTSKKLAGQFFSTFNETVSGA